MNKKPLVSIVIPTKNSGLFLENCLKSIKKQVYKNIEIIVVDDHSMDNTIEIAKKYRAQVFQFDPKLPKSKFDAPHRRNYGVKKSKGEYVYYADADYELDPNVVKESVSKCLQGSDAVVIPLDTFGTGIWTQAKTLERRCYLEDDTVEAPRFIKKSVWEKVGGLDENIAGGGDDWDLYRKLVDQNYKVGRIKTIVKHNEGNLTLMKLFKKAFMYGQDVMKYFQKRPKNALISYFPIRKGYIKNWRLLFKNPKVTLTLIIVRFVEYFGGLLGILYSLLNHNG